MGEVEAVRRGPVLWILAILAGTAVLGAGFAVGSWVGGRDDRDDRAEDVADATVDRGAPSSTAPSTSDGPAPADPTDPPDSTDLPDASDPDAAVPSVRSCDEIGAALLPDFSPAGGDRTFCTDRWAAVVTLRSNGLGVTILRAEGDGWVLIVRVTVVAEVRHALEDAGASAPHASALCGAVAEYADPSAPC